MLYGTALIVAPLFGMIHSSLKTLPYSDWSIFWAAGSMAGTPALVDPKLHCAHLIAHMGCQAFPYPPAVALLVWPLAKLSLLQSYVVEATLMLAFAIAAAMILADSFGFSRWFAILATLAWTPLRNSIIWGQNETLALFLIALAIFSARTNRKILLGVAIGALLYKPTIGVPFVALLVLRREWRAIAIVAVTSLLWYAASVIATAGHWGWPMQYVHNLSTYFAADFAKNASKSASLPDVLMQLGATSAIAAVSGIALFAFAIPKLLRVDLASALAITSVVGVATGLHAYNYAAAITLPALFYVMRTVAEPWRSWVVGLSYIIVFTSLFLIPGLRTWDIQVIAVLGLTLLLILYPIGNSTLGGSSRNAGGVAA